MKAYEYRHIVGFEETNLIGNVYYVNFLKWQGRCRELFLRDKTPSILEDIRGDLRLATVRCACSFHEELVAFDEVVLRMTLSELRQTSLTLAFDYVRASDGSAVARGEQEIACLRRGPSGLAAAPVPPDLRDALLEYEGG
jgi:enediyne biosynthesis thioesterase